MSLNAINSTHPSGTMHFIGFTYGYPVQILLDGGSNDNFIQPWLAKFLYLSVLPTKQFQVLVGDGNSLQVEGFIKRLQIHVQGHELHCLVYVLPTASVELILGVAWLETPGLHLVDYSMLTLQFL